MSQYTSFNPPGGGVETAKTTWWYQALMTLRWSRIFSD